MKAVIDEDLPRSFGITLSQLGFLVYDIRDHNLRGSTDEVIFDFAQDKKAVLFTADLDLANIIEFPLKGHYGICVLRFPNEMSTLSVNTEVARLIQQVSPKDFRSNLLIVSPSKIRKRS